MSMMPAAALALAVGGEDDILQQEDHLINWLCCRNRRGLLRNRIAELDQFARAAANVIGRGLK